MLTSAEMSKSAKVIFLNVTFDILKGNRKLRFFYEYKDLTQNGAPKMTKLIFSFWRVKHFDDVIIKNACDSKCLLT